MVAVYGTASRAGSIYTVSVDESAMAGELRTTHGGRDGGRGWTARLSTCSRSRPSG